MGTIPIYDEHGRDTVYWDWIVHDNDTVWSRRFVDMLGIDLADVERAQAIDFVLAQPFWLLMRARVANAADNGTMINERGSFTNPRGEEVTVWALGQRITPDGSAGPGGTSASRGGAAVGGTATPGTVVKLRFTTELDGGVCTVDDSQRTCATPPFAP